MLASSNEQFMFTMGGGQCTRCRAAHCHCCVDGNIVRTVLAPLCYAGTGVIGACVG